MKKTSMPKSVWLCPVCGDSFQTGSLINCVFECTNGHRWSKCCTCRIVYETRQSSPSGQNLCDNCSLKANQTVRQLAKAPTKEVSHYIFDRPAGGNSELRTDFRPEDSNNWRQRVDDERSRRTTIYEPRPGQCHAIQNGDRLLPQDTFNMTR